MADVELLELCLTAAVGRSAAAVAARHVDESRLREAMPLGLRKMCLGCAPL